MFVLVLTSHGGEGSMIGSDHRRVKLTDIYKLLSPKNFPAMQGKPKLVIIQACAGDLPFSPSGMVIVMVLVNHIDVSSNFIFNTLV